MTQTPGPFQGQPDPLGSAGSPEPTAPLPPPPVGWQPADGGYGAMASAGYPGAAMSGAAPYGVHPVSGLPYSDKSKVVAGLLQILLPFVGVCGVGRLYTGHVGIGLAQMLGMFVGFVLAFVLVGFLIMPVFWLWSVIDGVIMLTNDSKDAQGRVLKS